MSDDATRGIADASSPNANRTLGQRVFAYLREEIMAGRLLPGDDLHEVALSSSLGVSRGPLREALNRLAAEGLVTIVPRRGAIVTDLTREEFVEAYQIREALESLALRLAVPRLIAGDRLELHLLVDRMRRCAQRSDATGVFDASRDFSGLFVAATRNERLRRTHELLVDQMTYLLRTAGGLDRDPEAVVRDHERILAALDAADAERAIALLEELIRVPYEMLASDDAAPLFASG